jgi:hypothetical protein
MKLFHAGMRKVSLRAMKALMHSWPVEQSVVDRRARINHYKPGTINDDR